MTAVFEIQMTPKDKALVEATVDNTRWRYFIVSIANLKCDLFAGRISKAQYNDTAMKLATDLLLESPF